MGREWKLPGLLYVDDLVLCGKLEEDLRAMVGQFVEVCNRRGKSKVTVLNGEEGLESKVYVDNLGCVLDEWYRWGRV